MWYRDVEKGAKMSPNVQRCNDKGLDWLSYKTWQPWLFTQWGAQLLRNAKRKYIWAQPSARWTTCYIFI